MKKPKPPKSIKEVEDYIQDNGLRIDAKEFWRFFTKAEPFWYDSNEKPVRCWKKKLLTWDSFSTKPKPKTPAGKNDQDRKKEVRRRDCIRQDNFDYLNNKSTAALLDIKKDRGHLWQLAGWLIEEIIESRRN